MEDLNEMELVGNFQIELDKAEQALKNALRIVEKYRTNYEEKNLDYQIRSIIESLSRISQSFQVIIHEYYPFSYDK
jgi:hypothetical protein